MPAHVSLGATKPGTDSGQILIHTYTDTAGVGTDFGTNSGTACRSQFDSSPPLGQQKLFCC